MKNYKINHPPSVGTVLRVGLTVIISIILEVNLYAQEFESPSKEVPQPEDSASVENPASSDLSKEQYEDTAGIQSILDSFNLGSGAMDWRGKQFDLGKAEMAQARFEKYLNSPPSTSEDDLRYDTILMDISQRLIGKGGGSDIQRVGEAWRMLYQASEFTMDAGLSEILADRIVSFWQTNNKISKLILKNERLESDREYREAKIRLIADQDRKEFIELARGANDEESVSAPSLDYLSESDKKRLDKIEATILENESFELSSRITQKLEFQSLIVQFFVQRRFQHALIANDFYRYIFTAEESEVEGVDALKGQVFGDLDIKVTTSTLDALSKEAISDVASSLDTIDYLLEQGEIHNATKRLMEAFYLGEYLPSVKRYPLDKKRKIAIYIRDLTSLASSLEVKSFDRAQVKLDQIESYAKDFDGGKADAFIQTSKQLSNLAIQRALSAAYEQDRSGIEVGLGGGR